MGWLRSLMSSADPPVRGYGELARRSLAHPEWPAETRPQPRSLAALLSKLDRGIELEWLADRDAVQRTLALALGCPLESVQKELRRTSEAAPSGRLRLDDVPYAKPLDLKEEALPPGIPELLARPWQWEWTWWRAPSGSGRSLAGQWLSARGLASFVCARSWAEVRERLPATGPVFVEVERNEPAELALALPLLRRDVCVAAPHLPSEADAALSPAQPWHIVHAPAARDLVRPLTAWLGARLPDDGAFDAARAAAWLATPIEQGELPTFGALLGAAGLLDARGLAAAERQDLAQLAAAFVNERLEQTSTSGSAEAQWLKQYGFEALVRLAQTVSVDSDQPWDVARSRDEWIALIPAEFQQSVDSDWLRWSVSRSSAPGASRDLERALKSAPPGAYRLVRALVEARLLRPRGPSEALGIAPEFVKHASLVIGRQRLVAEGSPFSWGEGLLRQHAAAGLLDELERRIALDDFALVESLLELDLSAQPALVVAGEAVFVCLGLRLLSGGEVPLDHLESLWNEQLSWIVELPGELPQPRLLGGASGANASPLAEPAVWALSALAIGEALADRRGAAHPLLRPWGNPSLPARMPALLDAIFEAVCRPELARCTWVSGAFALAARLYATDSRGHLPNATAPHRLARPALLVQELLSGSLDFALLADWDVRAFELQALREHCELAGVSSARMGLGIWRCFQARGCPASGDALLGPASEHSRAFWPYLPVEVLELTWPRWAPLGRAWPFECFGPKEWSAFASAWSRHGLAVGGAELWEPAFRALDRGAAEHVLGALLTHAEDARGRALLAVLWSRFPDLLGNALSLRLSENDAAALARLLRSAPLHADSDVLARLTEGLTRKNTTRPIIDEARHWLWRKVAARGSQWRLAYAQLAELDERVYRALRARGNSQPA